MATPSECHVFDFRNDELVDPAAAKAFYEQAASQRKSFETDAFSSSAHELHNEE